MRPITKLFLGVLAVLALLQAAIVVGMAWPIGPSRALIRANWFWLRFPLLVLTGIIAVMALVALVVSLFRRSTSRDLHISGNQGDLVIAKAAVERSVAAAIAAEHHVRDITVATKMYRRRVARAKVKVTQAEVTDAQALAAAVEQTTKQQLERTLGVTVDKVRVRIQQAAPSKSVSVI